MVCVLRRTAVIRRAVIILLSGAGFLTAGLLVLSHLQWPGSRHGSGFGIDIGHSPLTYYGWWVNHGYNPGRPRQQGLHVAEGRITFSFSKPTRQFKATEYDWRPGIIRITRMSGWWKSTLRITMPLWLPLCLFLAYPVISFIRGPLRRFHRRRQGSCLGCGYDLTGNLSGTCPECGMELESESHLRSTLRGTSGRNRESTDA
jgi:hypothetical protein